MLRASLALLTLLASLASTASRMQREISMQDFVSRVTAKDTEFERILIDAMALKYAHDLALPAADILASVKQEQTYYKNPSEDDPKTTVSLTKLFPMTGTEISAAYSAAGRRNSKKTDSDLSVTLAQPIARNAFGRDSRLLKRITGLEVDVARFQITEAYEDYLATLMTLYLDWYEAYESLKIARSSYETNVKLLEDMKKRERSKIALPIDVNKSKIQLLSKKERLVAAQERYESRKTLILRSMRREETSDEELVPEPPDDSKREIDDFKTAFERFWSDSRTYQILKKLEDKSGLEVSREADGLLPSLDLLLTYESDGEGTGLKNADNQYVTGLLLSYPFGTQKAGARKKVAQIEERKTRLQTENLFHRLRAQLENLHRQMERENNLIEIADEKVTLARSILTDETENYSLAKVTLNDYIDAVNTVDSNRFSRISSSVLWQKLKIEWLRLTDSLIVQNLAVQSNNRNN